LREILECDYQELLETAESGCTLLTKLQNALIELLPSSQKLLPCNIEQLAGAEAQANLMTYISYYSLFAFADKAYTILNAQCTALAKARCSHNDAEEDDAADNLKKTLNALSRIPFDNLLDHGAVGLHRLDTFKDYLQENLDFLVIPVIDANGSLRSNWSFRDITGTIMGHGLSYEKLLTDCIAAPQPSAPTIGELVDNEKMVRIY
jgi:predicted negative regulator of RcsB-dependent stress response